MTKSNSEDPHRPRNVLELPFACILEGDIKLAPDLPMHFSGDANATGLRQALQTRCYVHVVAENIASIDDDVADVDANPELDALRIRHLGVALGHSTLNIKSAAGCVHYAAKLSQQPIAGVLDDTAAVFGNLGIDEGA
jgi:hypothetical protein